MLAQENLGTSSTSPNRVLWQLTDNIGSVRALANNAGAVASWTDTENVVHYAYANYSEFGLPDEATTQVASVFGTRYLWTGRERDPLTGEQYNRARYYDAVARRWISEDWIMQRSGDMNWYRYAFNQPVQQTDPSGKIVPLIAVGALIGANAWIWGKNAKMADDIYHNRQINVNDTPYSGQYYKGLATSSAIGAAVPAAGSGALALGAPAWTVTAGYTALGAYGTYDSGSQAVDQLCPFREPQRDGICWS